eukprot:Skav221375  [mRNA]  locus=scaffold2286:251746:253415:- [translate_table: standard]
MAQAQNVHIQQIDAVFQEQVFQQDNIQNKLALVKNEIQNAPAPRAQELARGAMDVAKSLKDNREHLQSGDALKITAGSLALAGSVLACAGPVGAGAGALCALAGAIMGFGMSTGPNVATEVRRIVGAAFRQFKDEELRETALSSLDIVSFRTAQVQSWLGAELNDREKTVLTGTLIDLNYLRALRPLREQISKHSKGKDKMAKRAAHYVVLYAAISSALETFYAELAAVLVANGMPNLRDTVTATLARLHSYHRETLQVVVRPSPETGRFYRALHKSLSEDQRRFLQKFLEQYDLRMQGRLCKIFNTHQGLFLTPVSGGNENLACRKLPESNFGLFRIFGPEASCTIYSIDRRSYMCAVKYKDFCGRRIVSLLPREGPVDQGEWNVTGGRMFNLHYEECMHADKYPNPVEGWKPIFTKRRDDDAEQGMWRISDRDFDTLKKPRNAECCIL